MKISVRVKPNSKEEKIEKVNDSEFVLRVKEVAKEGKANEAVKKCLSEYFRIPRSSVTIITGHKSKNKIIGLDI